VSPLLIFHVSVPKWLRPLLTDFQHRCLPTHRNFAGAKTSAERFVKNYMSEKITHPAKTKPKK
jgi:hypothetical protein